MRRGQGRVRRAGAATARASAAAVAAVLGVAVLLAGCGGEVDEGTRARLAGLQVPAEAQQGSRLFETHCAACHGPLALGTEQGPPLVHAVYRPAHHGDEAFQLAVQQGVRAHHWRFGDMPAVPGLTRADVADVIRYVRWLQESAGIR
jgi:mono/diheme cytochrome c family protein